MSTNVINLQDYRNEVYGDNLFKVLDELIMSLQVFYDDLSTSNQDKLEGAFSVYQKLQGKKLDHVDKVNLCLAIDMLDGISENLGVQNGYSNTSR